MIESVVEACEGDGIAFFDELEKLCAWAGPGGRLRDADVATLMRPVAGADLPGYLAAIAGGDSATAARRLNRLLAAGVGRARCCSPSPTWWEERWAAGRAIAT